MQYQIFANDFKCLLVIPRQLNSFPQILWRMSSFNSFHVKVKHTFITHCNCIIACILYHKLSTYCIFHSKEYNTTIQGLFGLAYVSLFASKSTSEPGWENFKKRAARCTKDLAYARSGKGSHHFGVLQFFTQEDVSRT